MTRRRWMTYDTSCLCPHDRVPCHGTQPGDLPTVAVSAFSSSAARGERMLVRRVSELLDLLSRALEFS